MIGYECFHEAGADWRLHHGAIIPMCMPHVLPRLSRRQARRIAIRHLAPFVRWEKAFDQLDESDWWHIIKDDFERWEDLKPKVRTKIRKGCRCFEAFIIDRNDIVEEAYKVYRDSFDRYSTFEKLFSESEFKEAVRKLPSDTEIWGVRERGSRKLVAFSENLVRDNACLYVTSWFQPDSLRASGGYAGYFLFYKMNCHYLNERSLRYVSDGARSINHSTNIHDFLERNFGFRRAYSQLQTVYFPGLGLIVSMLFPFREWCKFGSAPALQKVGVLLEQERIRRSCVVSGDRA